MPQSPRPWVGFLLLTFVGVANCVCNAGYTGAQCSACATGKYKGVAGYGACTPCEINEGTEQVATILKSDCVCVPGTYTYLLMGSLQKCLQCAAGKFQASYAAASCDDCPSGKYSGVRTFEVSDQASEDFCLPCPTNTGNSPPMSLDASACTCNAGSSHPQGSVCTSCEAGKYSTDTNSLTCTFCLDNTWSPDGSTSCQCKADWTTAGNGHLCTQCEMGKFKILLGDVACEECGFGKYRANNNSLSCSPCAAGKYSAAIGASSAATCLPCSLGTYTSGDGSKCEACPHSYAANMLTDAFASKKKSTVCIDFVAL
jgi:hypothetical protein